MSVINIVTVRGEDLSDKQQTGENKDDLVRKQIWRNRQNIKAFQKQASFIRFLFLEYRKIRDFGKKTHIFDPKILPPGIRLNKDVRLTFSSQCFHNRVSHLLSAVPHRVVDHQSLPLGFLEAPFRVAIDNPGKILSPDNTVVGTDCI